MDIVRQSINLVAVAAMAASSAIAAGPPVAAIVNGASYANRAVAPGSIAAVFGTFPVTSLVTSSGGSLPTALGGVSIQGGSISFPLFFVSAGQAGAQVPWELAGQAQVSVAASGGGQEGAPLAVKLAPFAPGIFSTNAQGNGQGAILDSAYRLVDPSNPASAGTVLQIYCTGLGAVTNQPASGAPSPSSPLAMTTTSPTVTVGGMAARVLFSGLAPGFVGLYQVNAQVPGGVSGDSAVPVVISIGGVVSNTVMIALASSPVTMTPSSAIVLPGGVQSFAATVANVLGGGVVAWSVQEGTSGGTVTSDGTYTAPSRAGTYHIVAKNAQNVAQSATATVTVPSPGFYTVMNPSSTSAGLVRNPSAAPIQSTRPPNDYFVPGLTGVFEMDTLGNVAPLGSGFGTGSAFPPASSLIQATDGRLYGTAAQGGQLRLGSVYTVDASGMTTVFAWRGINAFGDQGAWPQAALLQASDGAFYGTTYGGGTSATCTYRNGCGTVFKLDLLGNLTVLHAFSGPDGAEPAAPLIQTADGSFYGTTSAGGTNGLGTIFKMDRTGNMTVLHSFWGPDGSVPLAGLIIGTDGYLYGTASAGGSYACSAPFLNGGCGGAVFRMSLSGDFALLHAFAGPDGNEPVAPLAQASDGWFYGTTWAGGNLTCGPNFFTDNFPYFRQGGCGTVFRVDGQGNFTVVHAFASLNFGTPTYDGAAPVGGVIQGSDGNLYGTTYYGGAGVTTGTIFRIGLPH